MRRTREMLMVSLLGSLGVAVLGLPRSKEEQTEEPARSLRPQAVLIPEGAHDLGLRPESPSHGGRRDRYCALCWTLSTALGTL